MSKYFFSEDPRCVSEQGSYRCQGSRNHRSAHWADVGRSPAVLKWGMVGYGCSDPTCIRRPGHEMPHRDGKGVSWVPEGDEEYDPEETTPVPNRVLRAIDEAVNDGECYLKSFQENFSPIPLELDYKIEYWNDALDELASLAPKRDPLRVAVARAIAKADGVGDEYESSTEAGKEEWLEIADAAIAVMEDYSD